MYYLRSHKRKQEEERKTKRKTRKTKWITCDPIAESIASSSTPMPAHWNIPDVSTLFQLCHKMVENSGLQENLRHLRWEEISKSFHDKGSTFSPQQCKDKFDKIRSTWLAFYKKRAKVGCESYGLEIDDNTGMLIGTVPDMSAHLDEAGKRAFKCFLADPDLFDKCTDIFIKHTSRAALTYSKQITGSSKRGADEMQTFTLRNQRQKTDDVANVPSFTECYHILKAIPDLGADVVAKLVVLLINADSREMFALLTPEERLHWVKK
ncbi:hypothetical protein ABFX02_09G059000 [Erythranthe guttata]